MKNILLKYAPMFLALLSFTACGDEEKGGEEPVTLKVTPAEINVADNATTIKIGVEAVSEWTLNTNADWLHADMKKGGAGSHTVVCVVEANETRDARQTYVEVESGTKKASTLVWQDGQPNISLQDKNIFGDASAFQFKFTMVVTHAWTITSDSEWCTVAPQNGRAGTIVVQITCSENSSPNARIAKLTIKSGTSSETIEVTQSGKPR